MAAQVVCFHTELDRYTGSHGFAPAFLPGLVRELTLAVLLHDHVIVAPAVLTAHPLTLPAFEALAPLSRAGLLGTSTDRTAPSPLRYLSSRIDARVSELRARTGGVLGRQDHRRARELRARWGEVLPEVWPVRRPIEAQVRSFQRMIRERLALLASHNPVARWLVHHVSILESQGRPVSRDALIALSLGARARFGDSVVHEVLNTIQATTLELGARFSTAVGGETARACVYPGPWLGTLRASERLNRLPLPVDGRRSPAFAHAAFRSCGVDLDALTRVAPEDLLPLVTSPDWRLLRESVLSSSRDPQLTIALWARLRSDLRLRRGIPISPAIACGSTGVTFRTGTRRAVAALGMPFVAAHPNPGNPVLDTQRRELHDGSLVVSLSERQTAFLSLLAIAHPHGLTRSERHALEQELSHREELGAVQEAGARAAVLESRRRRTRSIDVRLRVAFHRLRAALESTRVRPACVGGTWLVEVLGGGTLRLRGWESEPTEPATEPPRLPSIRGGLQVVWRTLWSMGPGTVDLDSLCARIRELEGESRERARVARDVHELAVQLGRSGAPWTVLRHHGRYRIVELPGRSENK